MLSIGKLAPGPAAAEYYLRRRAGCELDYYTGDGERAGVWCGRGALALGLTGELTAERELVLAHLLAGRDQGGDRLVKPVWRADPRGGVPARTVVTALREVAAERGVEVPSLLGVDALVQAYARAEQAMLAAERRPAWPVPSVPADLAGRLLSAAGLDPAQALATGSGPGGRVRDRFGTALRHLTDRVDVRVSGLDLTLSAPKSVSVLYALGDAGNDDVSKDEDQAGSGQVGRAVQQAHRTAVAAAVDYLEMTCTQAFRGHQNADGTGRRIATRGLIGAAFEHRTSRCADPQLHTHVVVANLLHGLDGKWSAVDTREVYTQARTAGFVYQAVLRGELTRTLGVAWGPVRNGQADIAGLPMPLLRLFSKRRQAIDTQLALHGLEGSRAAQAATLATRPAKAPAEQVLSLRTRWAQEAAAAGHDLPAVRRLIRRGQPQQAVGAARGSAVLAGELTEALLGDGGLTLKRPTFDRRDLLRGVCEQMPAGTPVTLTDLRAIATRVLRDARVISLLADAPVRHRRYSTRSLLATERDALDRAQQRSAEQLATIAPEQLSLAMSTAAAAGLSAEQTAMVGQLLSSGAGVEVIVGPAGSGKTAALALARQAWVQAGVPVQGTALAAIAARVLQDGAGIPSRSVHRLLAQLARPAAAAAGQTGQTPATASLPPGGVLVVDEAGMVGTRTLHHLICLTQARQTKLVLVGDPHQLPEIDAGGLFATLAARLPALVLDGNQRQRQPWEQRALRQLRSGDVLPALTSYAEHDRLRLTDTAEELTARLLTDYDQARAAHPAGQVLVIASSRADARRLNAQLREQLIADGSLGPAELLADLGEHRHRSYRIGEQVIVTANDYPRGLLNGTRGVIEQLQPDRQEVHLILDDGRRLMLDRDYLRGGHLAHGYALTAHKAQGLTVDVALLWGSAALTRETGYVALSRGRQANYLYATWDTLRHDTGLDLDRPRSGATPSSADRAQLTRAALAERLDRSGQQRLARSWWRPRRPRPLDAAPATRRQSSGLRRSS